MSNNPINVCVSMINGNFNLPDSTVQSMKDIRAAVAECAVKLQDIFNKEKIDVGRAIASIDLLQQVKNTACDALILPHGK
jgi:hypothetical protein